MPMIEYVAKRFNDSSQQLIDAANRIIREYQAQGFKLTLRQLYYQFVARDLIPNNMQSYKRLGSVVNDARLAGEIDWDAIEDRTRNLKYQNIWGTTQEIIRDCSHWFQYDRWENQSTRIEVWIEKDALTGVIEPTCRKFRVPYFACRGYTSQSEAWSAGQRFIQYMEGNQDVVVLHFGDHDPSGIDMTRDNLDRLEMFTKEAQHSNMQSLEVKRLALNSDQVRKYNPPPNPAKLTDSRAQGYIAKFGGSSWELDALEPSVIAGLIENNIRGYIDAEAWQDSIDREEKARDHIRAAADKWKEPK